MVYEVNLKEYPEHEGGPLNEGCPGGAGRGAECEVGCVEPPYPIGYYKDEARDNKCLEGCELEKVYVYVEEATIGGDE